MARNTGNQDGGNQGETDPRPPGEGDLELRIAVAREEATRVERERGEALLRDTNAEFERRLAEANLQANDAHQARELSERQRLEDAHALAQAEAREAERNKWDRSGHRLEVRGPAGGRWRAGRHFTVVPKIIEPGTLTRVEREMIDTDPMLAVRATDEG